MAGEEQRDAERVLDLLWVAAESGSVSAQKVLYEHYRRDEADEGGTESGWEEIYGENVTPLRRESA